MPAAYIDERVEYAGRTFVFTLIPYKFSRLSFPVKVLFIYFVNSLQKVERITQAGAGWGFQLAI
jgi:hypothetical protein